MQALYLLKNYSDEVNENTGIYIAIAHVDTVLLKFLCSTYVPGVPSWAPYADLKTPSAITR